MPLQDSDNFIVGRGTDSYKITYQDLKDDLNYVPPPVLNLQVGKGSISPSIDLEEGDTLTGSATVTEAENPVEVHVWELDGTEVQRGSNATYVADAGQVRYRKEVTDDNNVSAKIGAWSDPVTVSEIIDDTVPNATMHGLRFDSGRKNYLSRTPNSGINKFTYSVWCKQTGSNVFRLLTVSKPDADSYSLLNYRGDNGKIAISCYGQSDILTTTTFALNQWHHFVVTYDGTSVVVYGNGAKVAEGVPNFEQFTKGEQPLGIGAWIQSGPQYSNGYLSDVYFVEQVLPPETFAKSFEGKWGPLDSSDVQENIKGQTKSPYETRPNMDEKWSDGLTGSGAFFSGNQPTAAFDGDLSNGAVVNAGPATITFAPSTPIDIDEKFEWYLTEYSNGASLDQSELTIDGTTVGIARQGAKKFLSIPEFVGKTISSTTPLVMQNKDNAQRAYFNGIKVDGQILVDGPADNSQNWSNGATQTNQDGADRGSDKLFDGQSTTIVAAGPGNNSQNLITLAMKVPVNTSVELFTRMGDAATGPLILLNDGVEIGRYAATNNAPDNWVLVSGISGPTSFNQIELNRDAFGAGSGVAMIKVDGKLLVDAGMQWNTDQVWSDGVVQTVGSGQYRPSNLAFDGDLNTSTATTPDTDLTFTFNLPAEQVGAVRVYHWGADTFDDQQYSFILNGSETFVPAGTTGTRDWLELGDAVVGSNTLVMANRGGAAAGASWAAVEIDGKLLVDPGSFGENGFYLPFDPEATGADWSNNVTAPDLDRGSLENLFDGDPNTVGGRDALSTNPSPTEGWTLTFNSTITGVKKVEILPYKNPSKENQRNTYQVNSEPEVTQPLNNDDWLTIYENPSVPISVASIFNKTGTDDASATWRGIKLDGKVLIDHNSIGKDASGQGNHFDDKNFAAGNTSQVWSKAVNALIPDNISSVLNNPVAMFNGGTDTSNLDNIYGLNPGTTGVSWEINYPAGTFTGGKYSIMGSNPSNIIYQFTLDNGTDIDSQTLGATDQGDSTIYTITIPNGVSLTKITCENDGISSANTVAHFYNGIILVDANIQDTVLDTPMKNYAVLETGKNGNLVGNNSSGDITYKGEVGTNYYYERNGWSGMHVGGSAFNGKQNSVYNFGQQPFNLQGFNDSQTWSDTASGTNVTATDLPNIFDGVSTTFGDLDADFTITGLNIPGPNVFILYSANAEITVKVNGAAIGTVPATAITTQVFLPFTGTVNSIALESGDRIGLRYIGVAGKVLVDPGADVIDAYSNQLYQTWTQWARTALGYAVDRIAKLEARNIQLEALVEEARTRLAALELNEVSDDAVDTALITLIGNINDRLTVLESN
jgi:hypothetical protein